MNLVESRRRVASVAPVDPRDFSRAVSAQIVRGQSARRHCGTGYINAATSSDHAGEYIPRKLVKFNRDGESYRMDFCTVTVRTLRHGLC